MAVMIQPYAGTLGVLACSLLVLATLHATAASQAIDPSPIVPSAVELLSGSYRYVGNPERDHATIQKSIDAAVTSLGWLGRRIAANRLANHKELPQRIGIARAGDNVSVTMGEYSAVAPIDGKERELVGPNGRDSKLSYRLTADAIVQYFVFEQAKRKSTYRLNESGQLVMSVYMTSEKLASPIQYDLVYERRAH
jgi:hypothetical protein